MLSQRQQTIKELAGIQTLGKDQLANIDEIGEQILFDYDNADAFRLAKIIEGILARTQKSLSPAVIKKLGGLLVKLQFLSLSYWSEAQTMALFENGLGQVLNDDFVDVYDRLHATLVETPIHLRDELKQKLLRRISLNQEVIISKKVLINNQEEPGTVTNILKDYLSMKDEFKAENIEIAEYFSRNKVFQQLVVEEKDKIRQLLKIFDLLNRSSFEPDGLENSILFTDEGGESKILDRGLIFSVEDFERRRIGQRPLKVPSTSPLEEIIQSSPPEAQTEPIGPVPSADTKQSEIEKEILAAYRRDEKQQKDIIKLENKLSKKFKDNVIKLRAEFFKIVQAKDVNKAVAVLRLLAQQNDLDKFLVEDQKLNKFLSVTWERQMGKELVREFKQKPAQPKFIRLFLRYILEQRLGMPASHAARVGMQIGNIISSQGQKEYNQMAYFDIKTKTFNWFE